MTSLETDVPTDPYATGSRYLPRAITKNLIIGENIRRRVAAAFEGTGLPSIIQSTVVRQLEDIRDAAKLEQSRALDQLRMAQAAVAKADAAWHAAHLIVDHMTGEAQDQTSVDKLLAQAGMTRDQRNAAYRQAGLVVPKVTPIRPVVTVPAAVLEPEHGFHTGKPDAEPVTTTLTVKTDGLFDEQGRKHATSPSGRHDPALCSVCNPAV